MSRLIDADALKEYFFRPYSNEESYSNIDISRIIDDQPTINSSAQPEQRWIPVSERLPINDDWVIVTINDESGDTPYKYSDFGWYLEAAKCWIIDAQQRKDVIAWMPLPAPFKEDKQ